MPGGPHVNPNLSQAQRNADAAQSGTGTGAQAPAYYNTNNSLATVPPAPVVSQPSVSCGTGYIWAVNAFGVAGCEPALPAGTGNPSPPITSTGGPNVVATSIWSSPDAEYILIGAAVVLFLVLMVVFLRK